MNQNHLPGRYRLREPHWAVVEDLVQVVVDQSHAALAHVLHRRLDLLQVQREGPGDRPRAGLARAAPPEGGGRGRPRRRLWLTSRG